MGLKNLFIALLIPLLGFANFNIEKINEILSLIRRDGNTIRYFSSKKWFISKLSVSKAKGIDDADVIIFPTSKDVNRSIIVDSYDRLKRDKSSIGAIYMKKGRTQILFVDERLNRDGFSIPQEFRDRYEQYIIKECHLRELCLFK
ncbi:MAG: hypothetical protein GXO06_05025 [Epsilonproteobacteria bacterium]|nr:hypothetical protein [Campylobacterota bacterium]